MMKIMRTEKQKKQDENYEDFLGYRHNEPYNFDEDGCIVPNFIRIMARQHDN